MAKLGTPAVEAPEELQRFVAERSREAAVDALSKAGAWCSPVNSAADIYKEGHVWERGNLVRIEDPDLGTVVIPGVVPTFARARAGVTRWSRSRGSDNDIVLRDLLGYGPERIAELTRPSRVAVEAE